MHWELWDTESGNLIDEFETEKEGLIGARDVLAVNASGFVDQLALGDVGDDGDMTTSLLAPVLWGAALIEKIGTQLDSC